MNRTIQDFAVGQKVQILTAKGGVGIVTALGRKYVKVQAGINGKPQDFDPRMVRPA